MEGARKEIILSSGGGLVFLAGLVWFRRSLSASATYDFRQDLRSSFFTLRSKYGAQLNDGTPRRIAPFILMLAGLTFLGLGLAKILASV